MKYAKRIGALVLTLMIPAAEVYGDAGKDVASVEYATDYFMIVDSEDGGVDFYPYPDLDSTKLNEELIPNGTAFHIEGEVTGEDGTEWGATAYQGMEGYVLLDDLRPVSPVSAAEFEFQTYGGERTNYEVSVTEKEEDVILYKGPGEKFGEADGENTAKEGERFYISKEVETEDGNLWGKASNEEKQGWLHLEDTDRGKPEKEAVTPEPTKAVEATPTPEPTKASEATPTPEPTKAVEATPTPEPTKASEATPTPEPTEAAKVTSTPKAAATEKPKSAQKGTVTPEAKAAASAQAEASEDSNGKILLTAGILGVIFLAALWMFIVKRK